MHAASVRLVLDTIVLLAGLVSFSSASQKVVELLQARQAIPLLSQPLLSEYRAVLLDPGIAERFPSLSEQRVESAIRQLRYVGDEYREISASFRFDRDPRDAKLIELAIAGSATHILTFDADLRSLPTSRKEAGKRFRQRLPRLSVQTPRQLLVELGQ